MSDIKIEDNFLSPNFYKKVENLFDPHSPENEVQKKFGSIPWSLGQIIYGISNIDNYQLSHVMYHQPCADLGATPITSSINDLIFPAFFSKIYARSILRIKSNLQMRTSEIIKNKFHQDYNEDFDGVKTSIYYLNTNNGYTEFEDGTIIESIGNRLVTFPCNMKHRGTTCTNKPFRIVINFNYF